MILRKIANILLLACVISPVHAEINWTSEQGNAAHTGFVNISTNPEKYHQLWDVKLTPGSKYNARVYSSVYDKSRGYYVLEMNNRGCGGGIPPKPRCQPRVQIHALNTATGKLIWEKDISLEEYQFISSAHLRVANNKLILIDTIVDRYPDFTGYNLDNGSKLFSSHSDGRIGYSETDGKQLYTAYSEYETLGNLNLETGKMNWRKDGKTKFGVVQGFALANDYLVRAIDNVIVVNYRKSGDRLFEIKPGQDQVLDSNLTIDAVTNTAYLMYMPSRQAWDYRTLYAYNLANPGEIRWEMSMQQKWVTPVIAGYEIYSVEHDPKAPVRLNAINAVTGKINWTWQIPNDEIDTAINLIATTDTIFITCRKYIYAVSRPTHQVVWRMPISASLLNSVERIEISDNKLFIHSVRVNGDRYSADYVTAIALN